ncbi:MAG: FliM/FliN family flagellar motor switch protein [Paracoccaceae bacterium]
MTEITRQSVLRRKAEAGAASRGAVAMTPARALHHALAKTAQDLLRLPIDIASMRELRLSLSEIPEQLDERALLMVLAGPEETLGLMVLSPTAVSTLIEVQTTGRVGKAPVAPRRPTRTDAAMCSRFVNQTLSELELLLATDPAIIWAGGFRQSSFLDDPRPLALLLEDVPYRTFKISLRFGEGREGAVLLALPAEGRGPAPERGAGADPGAAAEPPDGHNPAEWAGRMEAAVLDARAGIEAVLDRISLPLAELLALRPGALLPLPPDALSRLRIEGQGGRLIVRGRLGQCRGQMAVRVYLDAEPEDAEIAGAVGRTALQVSPGAARPDMAEPAAS